MTDWSDAPTSDAPSREIRQKLCPGCGAPPPAHTICCLYAALKRKGRVMTTKIEQPSSAAEALNRIRDDLLQAVTALNRVHDFETAGRAQTIAQLVHELRREGDFNGRACEELLWPLQIEMDGDEAELVCVPVDRSPPKITDEFGMKAFAVRKGALLSDAQRVGVFPSTLIVTHVFDGEEVVRGGDDAQVYIATFSDSEQAEKFIKLATAAGETVYGHRGRDR